MKQGKTTSVAFLVLEIVAIAVLHAVKLNQAEKAPVSREVTRSIISTPTESREHTSYSWAVFK